MRFTSSILITILIALCGPTHAQDDLSTAEIISTSTSIKISLIGAYPTAWDFTDQEFVEEDTSVPLIYPNGDPATFPYPFKLTLDGPDGPLTTFANTALYTHDAKSQGDDEFLHTSVSPVHESGLQITKIYASSDHDFTTNLQILFKNTNTESSIALDNPTITLGAGLGGIPGSIGGLGDSMYSYVEPVGFGLDLFTPFRFEDDTSEIAFPQEDEIYEAIGLHNRYYLFALQTNGFVPASGTIRIPHDALEASGIPAEAHEFFPEVILNLDLPEAIEPEQEIKESFSIYAGPKDAATLEATHYDLSAVLYYSLPNWMRWLTFKLSDLLNAINGLLHAWWLTLLALVLIIRILLFPLAHRAIKMNEKMLADQAKLKPEIRAIKEKHKDPTLQYQKTMELYKAHDINPFAPMLGCVPVLFQLPILIAIFNLLGQEVKMQGASFLWISDLSIPDQLFALPFTLPYFGGYFNLLPVLMSVTMVLTTNLGTPAEGDQKKTQMRTMIILAVIFFTLFYSFPAGLVFYWMMSNVGQFAQQEFMKRRARKKAKV